MYIFKGQTKLRMQISLPELDFSTVQSASIKLILPDSTVKTFAATVVTDSKHIYYDVQSATDLPLAGVYKMYPVITFVGGGVNPGKSISFTVYNEGE